MPTRKQRKRRAKDKRHDYEYVYVDEAGQEVEVDDGAPAKPAKQSSGTRPGAKQQKAPAKGGKQRPATAWREVKPPSWSRVGRRGLIFAPVMVVVVYLLKPANATPASVILQVIVLLAFFLPFSYFMDGVLYRQYRKKIGDPLPPRRAPKD